MRRRVLVAAAVAWALAGAGSAAAQPYPSRPITLVVPLGVGGSTDVIGRLIAEGMRTALGQAVIVENTTGAGGTIGVGRVARAAPDGYTIGIGQWGTNVATGAIYPLSFDLLNDFEPVGLIATQPFLIVGKKATPANDLNEFIAYLKARQTKISQGNSGIGTLDVLLDTPALSLPQVRGGAIKAYAVAARTRLATAPEIPTTDEAGLPGFYFSFWHAIWAPKGTPKEIVARLNDALVTTLADAAIRKKLLDLSQDIFPREQLTPRALYAFHKAEIEKWWPIIKAAGIRAE
jgi:tripartite-type tricarboxylate transporter receptor subunit TctC